MTPSQKEIAQSIKRKIEYWVYKNSTVVVKYSNWYVGITKNPRVRKNNHASNLGGTPYFFKSWHASSVTIAKAIETHFHKKGMREKDIKGGIKKTSWYVYVFKKYPTIFD